MKHTILTESGAALGTIEIDDTRAAEIAAAKADAPSEDGIWHFIAGDWLTDEEIESLGTSHELEIQIIAEGGASGRLVCYGACKQHDGEVRKVRVLSIKTGHDWGVLNYCAAAIAEDESRGLTVVEEGGAE